MESRVTCFDCDIYYCDWQVKRCRTKGGLAGADGIKSVFGQLCSRMSLFGPESLMLPHRVWKVKFIGWLSVYCMLLLLFLLLLLLVNSMDSVSSDSSITVPSSSLLLPAILNENADVTSTFLPFQLSPQRNVVKNQLITIFR